MAQAAAKIEETVAVDPNRKKPRLRDIWQNSQMNHIFREMAADAPEDFQASDLNDPECFDGGKLMVDDHLYIRANDRSWAADGVITWTNNREAVFSITKLHWSNRQRDPLPSDENYQIRARGGFFDVIRRVDGVPVAEGLATLKLATQALANQYPKKVD